MASLWPPCQYWPWYSVNGTATLHSPLELYRCAQTRTRALSRCYSRGVCLDLIACFICAQQIAWVMARLQLDLPPPRSPSLCLTLLRFWVPLFGFLMKCHAVQVQLVFYGALFKSCSDVFCQDWFLLFFPYSSSSSSSSAASFAPTLCCLYCFRDWHLTCIEFV